MNPIKIIIADDHAIFREGLVALLTNEEDIDLVGEAQNGFEVLDLVVNNKVDIILMDVEMPLKNGLETARELRKTHPEIKILVLTMHKSPAFVKQLLKAGASGYILKETGKEELLNALNTIAKGGQYHSAAVTRSVMESLHKKNRTTSHLSKRELQIIQLISNELTTNEIAKELHLSSMTVETHRKNIFLKLGVRNIAGLVKLAFKNGWIE